MPIADRARRSPGLERAPRPGGREHRPTSSLAEAMVNAVKHAHARELGVSLGARRRARCAIEVRDDGIGGAAATRRQRDARRWPTASRRSAAGCAIDSAAGGGTRVVAELPCAS